MPRQRILMTLAVCGAVLAVLLPTTSCTTATPAPPPSSSLLQPPPPDGVPTMVAHQLSANLGLTVQDYLRRSALASKLSSTVDTLRQHDSGVQLGWITADGQAVIGVSSRHAQLAVERMGWRAQAVESSAVTERRLADVEAWVRQQPPQLKDSIVLIWPDYVRGGVNIARDIQSSALLVPAYPPTDLVRERRGIMPSASSLRPPRRSTVRPEPVHPGDGYLIGGVGTASCTVGPVIDNRVITVPHCTTTHQPALPSGGAALGTYSGGPTAQTRSIVPVNPADPTIRVDGATMTTSGPAKPVLGAPVCTAGISSGWTCGLVVGLTPDNGFISTSCSVRGDSGGPAVLGRHVIGVTDLSTMATQSACPPPGDSRYLTYTVHRALMALDN